MSIVNARVLTKVTLGLVLILPLYLSFNFIFRFGVNSPFWDEWDFIPIIVAFENGRLTLDSLLTPHNEHVLIFPKLLILTVSHLTHFNTVAQMYCGWFLMFLGTIAILFNHLRVFGRSYLSWLSFAPIAFLLFTLRQYENLLWGWQVQIFLSVFAFMVSAYWLDQAFSARTVISAISAAIVSTFSFGAGLAVWPAGLLLIASRALQRENRRSMVKAMGLWCLAGSITGAVYFLLASGQVQGTHFQPVLLLTAIGGAVTPDVRDAFAFGLMFAALFLGLVSMAVSRQIDWRSANLGLALLVFGLVGATLIVSGRSSLGESHATTSRYTTITVMLLIGLYRLALSIQLPTMKNFAVGFFIALTALGMVSSLPDNYIMGRAIRRTREAQRRHLLNYRDAPDDELHLIFHRPAVLRESAAMLERQRLSVFQSDALN